MKTAHFLRFGLNVRGLTDRQFLVAFLAVCIFVAAALLGLRMESLNIRAEVSAARDNQAVINGTLQTIKTTLDERLTSLDAHAVEARLILVEIRDEARHKRREERGDDRGGGG